MSLYRGPTTNSVALVLAAVTASKTAATAAAAATEAASAAAASALIAETSPGIQGIQGPQGFQGLTGDVGPQGPTGPQGVEGPTGPQGTQGVAGSNGSGSGTVTSVTGVAPIEVSMGTSTPTLSIVAATTLVAGSMSATDKAKLDGVAANATNYTHPTNHAPSIITQDASNRFVTDAEKTAWNAKQPAGTYAGGTGTASGTNTGDQTTITGNAGTATALSAGADRTKLDGITAGANVTATGVQTLTNKTITDIVFTLTGATPALTATNGAVQTWTLTAASTPTNSLTSGQSIILVITPGAFAVTWPSVTWTKQGGSGAAPTLFSAGKTSVVLWRVGAVLYGSHLGDTV